jgi:soluble lytic murein transglycosylase-like protein
MTWPTAALAQDGPITAFVERDGRVVFTNIAAPVPLPRIATGISGAAVSTIGPAATPDVQPGVYDGLIHTISSRHGVDPLLVRAVIKVESNFDRRAVSSKGARGLMQLIPATGSRFGVRDFFDPAQNIEGGVRYLRSLLEMFDGNLDLTLAAYNSGENRVARLGRIPDIRETRDYVRKVRNAYAINARAEPPAPVAEGQADRRESPAPDQTARDDRAISSSVDAQGVIRFSNMGSFR